MNTVEEQVFIVYSVLGTKPELVEQASESIRSYRRPSYVPSVKAVPKVFEIPSAAEPGAALGTILSRELDASIGAIVFLDDIRPNVAYELGFFHGRGQAVLLVTSSPDHVWRSISDLAGWPLLDLTRTDIMTGINAYLDSVYVRLTIAERGSVPSSGGIASHDP